MLRSKILRLSILVLSISGGMLMAVDVASVTTPSAAVALLRSHAGFGTKGSKLTPAMISKAAGVVRDFIAAGKLDLAQAAADYLDATYGVAGFAPLAGLKNQIKKAHARGVTPAVLPAAETKVKVAEEVATGIPTAPEYTGAEIAELNKVSEAARAALPESFIKDIEGRLVQLFTKAGTTNNVELLGAANDLSKDLARIKATLAEKAKLEYDKRQAENLGTRFAGQRRLSYLVLETPTHLRELQAINKAVSQHLNVPAATIAAAPVETAGGIPAAPLTEQGVRDAVVKWHKLLAEAETLSAAPAGEGVFAKFFREMRLAAKREEIQKLDEQIKAAHGDEAVEGRAGGAPAETKTAAAAAAAGL